MDFKAAFKNKDGLLTEWEQTQEKIHCFLLIDNHIKDRNIKQLVEKLNSNTTSVTESKHLKHFNF